MLVGYYEAVYLGIATSTISLTITKAKVTKPLRTWVQSKSKRLGSLISCPYCTSHWIAFILCLIYEEKFDLIDWFVSSMMIVAIAAIFSGLVFTSISKIHGSDEE